jgi:cobalt/nickel transport system permease protein
VSGGHGPTASLYVAAASPLHRLAPQCKLAAALLFVFAVVATPREAFWAFAVYALALAALARVGRVPLAFVARRMVIEVPFVAFALFLPFVAQGERVEVAGLSLATEGLWAAWNIVAKATLGVATTVVLAATTPVAAILDGFDRLRVPRLFTAVAGFMVRYLDVVVGEARRMRVARLSRGDNGRWLWQARAVATSAGTLFVRSFERGERVHLAMLSRGFDGSLPVLADQPAGGRQWGTALALPVAAAAVAVVAWATVGT